MKPPVVVIPGVTATTLKDFYPTSAETVWGMLAKDYLRVALHPDNLRYEQIEPALLRPDEPLSIPYDEFVKELRHDLTRKRDEPRPVFLFSYDWRQPLEVLVEHLKGFLEEVVARTALLRHYARDTPQYSHDTGRVDLVGHSMGGLLVAGYLARNPSTHRARKVVTLGTPFGGSFEAVIKVITGTSGLDTDVPRSREREVARVTPSLYHLIPGREVLVESGPSSLPDSLFHVDLWQRSVLESVAEHIRHQGVAPERSKAGRLEQAKELLQGMLDRARRFRAQVDQLRLEQAGLGEEDWMAVVGIGQETRLSLEIQDRGAGKGSHFRLRSLHRKNGYPVPVMKDDRVVADLDDTGDGTVPYWAAVPPFMDPCRLVCVSPDDFGYWELRDRLLGRHIANLHSMLPAMNRVIKLSAAFLDARQGARATGHPGIRGRRAPECLEGDRGWDPPFRNLKETIPEEMGGVD